MKFEPVNAITCDEAQRLMVPVWAGDPDLAERQREAFESHLYACQSCRTEYDETRRLMSLVREHAMGGVEEHENGEAADEPWRPMTDEEGWEDLKRRCWSSGHGLPQSQNIAS